MTKAADGEVPYTDEKLVAAADKIAEWQRKDTSEKVSQQLI